VDIEELIGRCPRVYHMAADGSWPSIRDRGLLPTKALVELCDVPRARQQDLLRARRPQTIELPDRHGNTVSIRDQKPLKLHNLRLVGTDFQGWLDLLNTQAFFWVDEDRLRRLLSAQAYLPLRHHVLTIDTENSSRGTRATSGCQT
jgi:hypothetical protein